MITIEIINSELSSIIEEEYGENVIVLDETETTKRTVTVDTFVSLFSDAEFTYESLTQEKYEKYKYKPFFDMWNENGLLPNEEVGV